MGSAKHRSENMTGSILRCDILKLICMSTLVPDLRTNAHPGSKITNITLRATIPFLLLQHFQVPIPRVILTRYRIWEQGALQKTTFERAKRTILLWSVSIRFQRLANALPLLRNHNNGQICKDRADNFIQEFNLSEPRTRVA